jgi:hypothetical protein
LREQAKGLLHADFGDFEALRAEKNLGMTARIAAAVIRIQVDGSGAAVATGVSNRA